NELKTEATPMFQSIKVFVDKANTVADKIDYVADGAGKIVDNANTIVEKGIDIADDVVDFERRIKRSIEPQIFDTLGTYTAIIKGVKVFFDRLKSRSNGSPFVEFKADANANFYSQDIQDEYDEIDEELNEVRKKLDEMKKH